MSDTPKAPTKMPMPRTLSELVKEIKRVGGTEDGPSLSGSCKVEFSPLGRVTPPMLEQRHNVKAISKQWNMPQGLEPNDILSYCAVVGHPAHRGSEINDSLPQLAVALVASNPELSRVMNPSAAAVNDLFTVVRMVGQSCNLADIRHTIGGHSLGAAEKDITADITRATGSLAWTPAPATIYSIRGQMQRNAERTLGVLSGKPADNDGQARGLPRLGTG
jgi:hypothetical protein